MCGETGIFIYPGYRFKAVDALITNFHLPESTLLMLVSAFYNREKMLEVYKTAVEQRYRFFSFGDCMLIQWACNELPDGHELAAPWIAPAVHELPSALRTGQFKSWRRRNADEKSWCEASIHDGSPSIHLISYIASALRMPAIYFNSIKRDVANNNYAILPIGKN